MPKTDNVLIMQTQMVIDGDKSLLDYPFFIYLRLFFDFAVKYSASTAPKKSILHTFYKEYLDKTLTLPTLALFLIEYFVPLCRFIHQRNKIAFIHLDQHYLYPNTLIQLKSHNYQMIIEELHSRTKKPVIIATTSPYTQLIMGCLEYTLPKGSFQLLYVTPNYVRNRYEKPAYCPTTQTEIMLCDNVNITLHPIHTQSSDYFLITEATQQLSEQYLRIFNCRLWNTDFLNKNTVQSCDISFVNVKEKEQELFESIASTTNSISELQERHSSPAFWSLKKEDNKLTKRSEPPLKCLIKKKDETAHTPPRFT